MPTHAQAKPKYRKAPVRFKQSEMQRAIRGAQAEGLQVGRVEVDPVSGKIIVVTVTDQSTDTDQQNTNESRRWDERVANAKDKKRTA
jgi:hypothetical protein